MLILPIAKDLHKLLQYCSMATMTPLSKLSGIVEVAIHLALVFVVRVLRTKHRRTYRAGEMFNMILAVQSRNIRATQGTTTLMAQKIQSSEVVSLAQRVLSTAIVGIDGKELGRNDIAAILRCNRQNWRHAKSRRFCATYLAFKTLKMKGCTQRPYELTSKGFTALFADPRCTPGRLGTGSSIRTRPIARRGSISVTRAVAWS